MNKLQQLKKETINYFYWKDIENWVVYEYINEHCWLCETDILLCLMGIDLHDFKFDKGYVYWETTYDYLFAILCSYMDKWIRDNFRHWECTIEDFLDTNTEKTWTEN